jgi:integrase
MKDGVNYSIGTFATITDAKAALVIAQSQLARGEFIDPAERRRRVQEAKAARERAKALDPRTVSEMFAVWLDYLRDQGLKEGSVYTYERRIAANLIPKFGKRPVISIAPEEVDQWIHKLEQTKGLKAAGQIHLAVAALFRFGSGDAKNLPPGFAPYCIASPVPPPNARRIRRQAAETSLNRKPVSADEIMAIADGMPAEERLAVLLAGHCALRIGEVLALRRRHITEESGVYWVEVDLQLQARGTGLREETPKTKAGRRRVPVPPMIAPDLELHLREFTRLEPESLLFKRRGGREEFLHPNTLRVHFNNSMSELNTKRAALNEPLPAQDRLPMLKQFTFHGLRHTALTRLGQAGATAAELKAFGGHSDGESVARYQHAESSRLASLVSKLSGGNDDR